MQIGGGGNFSKKLLTGIVYKVIIMSILTTIKYRNTAKKHVVKQ